MFICSFKLNKTKFLSGIAVICLTLTLIFLMLPESPDTMTSASNAASQQEMTEYLDTLGYTVEPQAILIEDILIPAEFDEKYTAYNEMQKPAGFDLSQYKGQSAKKYTFKVLNFEDTEKEVVINLLVLNNKVIGGDISSTELGGFSRGLIQDQDQNDGKKTTEDSKSE